MVHSCYCVLDRNRQTIGGKGSGDLLAPPSSRTNLSRISHFLDIRPFCRRDWKYNLFYFFINKPWLNIQKSNVHWKKEQFLYSIRNTISRWHSFESIYDLFERMMYLVGRAFFGCNIGTTDPINLDIDRASSHPFRCQCRIFKYESLFLLYQIKEFGKVVIKYLAFLQIQLFLGINIYYSPRGRVRGHWLRRRHRTPVTYIPTHSAEDRTSAGGCEKHKFRE